MDLFMCCLIAYVSVQFFFFGFFFLNIFNRSKIASMQNWYFHLNSKIICLLVRAGKTLWRRDSDTSDDARTKWVFNEIFNLVLWNANSYRFFFLSRVRKKNMISHRVKGYSWITFFSTLYDFCFRFFFSFAWFMWTRSFWSNRCTLINVQQSVPGDFTNWKTIV